MLAEYLGPEGFEVVIARSGEEGLDRAHESEYALIILDVMLPQINGFEVLPAFAEAIAVSGHHVDGARTRSGPRGRPGSWGR